MADIEEFLKINDRLIEKLKKFRTYVPNDEEQEWKQIFAIANFIIDVIRTLNWEQRSIGWDEFNDKCKQTQLSKTLDDICDEFEQSLYSYLLLPYKDEFNTTIWQKFGNNPGKNAAYTEAKIKEIYPGIEKLFEQIFLPDKIEKSKEEQKWQEHLI